MWFEKVLRGLRAPRQELPRVDPDARLATYPPPYPNGWYTLCEAAELKPGAVRFVEALGQKLALFRAQDGALGLLDAYCPHLGANLAGGKVRDGCLECPFHQWSFQCDGKVAGVPYLERVPAKLATRAWPVAEYHGMIVMWFAAEQAAPAEKLTPLSSKTDVRSPAKPGKSSNKTMSTPHWQLQPIAEIDSGQMVYRGHHDAGIVNMHLCEFAENSADDQHFAPLHGDMFLPWTNIKLPVLGVHHEASWERDKEQSHVAYFHDEAILTAFGKPIPNSGARATIKFHGPGSLVSFRFHRDDIGSLVMFHTHLPVAPLQQRVRFRWYADQRMPRAVASYIVGNWISQWREDIDIWENKIFQRKPMLVAGDGPMHPMRRWFAQFYETPKPVAADAAE